MKAMPSMTIRSMGKPDCAGFDEGRLGMRWGGREGPPQDELGDANAVRARTLRAGLDLERHPLTAGECIEVQRRIDSAAVEEVLLAIFGLDEAETAVGDDLLDGPLGHLTLLFSNMTFGRAGLFEKKLKTTANSPSGGRCS